MCHDKISSSRRVSRSPLVFVYLISVLLGKQLYSRECNFPARIDSYRLRHIQSNLVGETTTYDVTSIPYAPFPYIGGTTVSVDTDDVWSPAIDLPFNFCFFGGASLKTWRYLA